MSERLPAPLAELTAQIARLPGLGPKSALRVAMALLRWPEAETRRLGAAIGALRDVLGICPRCGGLSAASPCPVCADEARERDTLCLVAEWDSMLVLDEGGFYRGQYMILGGLLAPGSAGGGPDLGRLTRRLEEGEIRELILGLGATAEAESTAAYVRHVVGRRFPDVRVSRLAQGIPLGAEVKFMDRETLRQAWRHRQLLRDAADG